MRATIVVSAALLILFSSEISKAGSIDSQDARKTMQVGTGPYSLWWPTALDVGEPYNWTWILAIANINGTALNVTVRTTGFSPDQNNVPVTTTLTVPPFGKRFLQPQDFALFNTVADILVSSDGAVFGGTLYLLDASSGRLITTVPHIVIENP
jgi:hypothetical protein